MAPRVIQQTVNYLKNGLVHVNQLCYLVICFYEDSLQLYLGTKLTDHRVGNFET